MSDDLVRAIIELREMYADLAKRVERMFRHGKATDVDPKKGLYRQEIGVDAETGEAMKSGWIPYAQSAGARKSHSPPSVGQQMTQISPDGDFSQAFGVPHHWSKENASPSDKGDEDVDQRGASKDTTRADRRRIEVGGSSITIEDGAITLESGGVAFTFSGAGFEQTGGQQTHDGSNVGATHVHPGVVRGAAKTDPPE